MEEPSRDSNRCGFVHLKCYEQLLVNKMMGTSRHNEPLQAVIDNQLNNSALQETNNSVLERNRALLQYIATIANSNSQTDEFNYEFIESLVKGGADINISDQYEQSIFHEVARSWNIDTAKFLLKLGCNINKKDSFGRTPLHVAAAVDFVEMTEFLLQNNADIDARTEGESQTPIHYAAKNGATRSLKMLLGFHANIDSPDAKQRTPLQLAAEWTRDKTAKVLIDEGAASCLLDSSGNSALCILIDRLPNLAVQALNQLHISDVITRTDSYYLQYLEASRQKVETKATRTPLETAVVTRKYEVVTHPVMQRLIHNKWKHFGRLSTIFDLLFHIIFGIVWTAFALGTPTTGKKMYFPINVKVWQIIIGLFILLMTMYDIAKQINSTIQSRKSQENWIHWRTSQLQDDLNYCHPRWPQERKYVDYEVKRVHSLPLFDAYDAWFYLEWIILILILATIATHFIYVKLDSSVTRYIYTRTISVVNLLVWLRLLKYVRPFPGIGTLVIILGETTNDFINWAFLFFLILVPFTAAFWINFGEVSLHPIHGYHRTSEMIYTVFRIAVGDDFHLEGIVEADPVTARILVALYVTAMTIVTLNLLIALLSDTFSRVYGNAVANTIMQRAIKTVEAERMLTKNQRTKYREHMKLVCSPEVTNIEVDSNWNPRNEGKITEDEMTQNLIELKLVLNDRFGKVFGKNKSSDFDAILDDLRKLQALQNQLSDDLIKINEMTNLLSEQSTFIPKPEAQRTGNKKDKTSVQNKDRVLRRESKGIIATLQDTAASLMPSWFTSHNKEESNIDTDLRSRRRRRRQSEEKSLKPGRKEKKRGKRRSRERDGKKSEERTVYPGRSHTRGRRRSERHGSSSNPYVLRRSSRTNGDANEVDFQNPTFQNENELAWDNVSIDSGKI